jgi:hypothetical protein
MIDRAEVEAILPGMDIEGIHPNLKLLCDVAWDWLKKPEEPLLGLATTRELLTEISARIEVDHASGGGGLDYRTVDGR